MESHFDLIALPKGQLPGGPIQASNGLWCLVLPAQASLPAVISMFLSFQAGRPVPPEDVAEARRVLAEKLAD